MPKYSPRELAAVRIFGGILLGLGLLALIGSTPQLLSSYTDGRFHAEQTTAGVKGNPADRKPLRYIPGLAGVVFGVVFSALGTAALLAQRRATRDPGRDA